MIDENITTQIMKYKVAEKDSFFLEDLQRAEAAQDEQDLYERFYTDLEFGTGGIRGIIGAGTNRLNTLVVQRVAEGWAQYLHTQYADAEITVIIAFDSRHFSKTFSEKVSEVLLAHGIKVLCYTTPRPTPQLSFTIRALGAQSGLVITASHNPSQYNGLKIYWNDGAQVIAPHDTGIMQEIEAAKLRSECKTISIQEGTKMGLYGELTAKEDEIFQEYVGSVLLQPEVFQIEDDFRIVYTPLHGTGAYHIQQIMERYAIKGTIEPSQKDPDGDFPTVKFPNPEDANSLVNAITTAKKEGAHLVVATDPDADRVGIAERAGDTFVCISGNQMGALLLDYIVTIRALQHTLRESGVFINTIVTTFLQDKIAYAHNIEVQKTYTGFKNIAEAMANIDSQGKNFVFACEESYGYLASTSVRDKDGISISLLIIEMAKYYFSHKKTLSQRLEEIYMKYGYHDEQSVSVTLEGSRGKEKISEIMTYLRTHTPLKIGGENVVCVEDYLCNEIRDVRGTVMRPLGVAHSSNVLIFKTENENTICARPSGTEPKIKFYLLYQLSPAHSGDLVHAKTVLDDKIKDAKRTLENWIK